jgi:transposase
VLSAGKFTAEARTGILARLELGMSLSEAAEAVGVHPATARGWLFRGRKADSGALRDFADAVEVGRGRRPRRQAPLEQLVRAGSIRAARRYWGKLRGESRP